MNTSKTATEKIRRDEKKYNDFIGELARRVAADRSLHLLTVAGPSCSGKTTTTAKLLSELSRRGRASYMLSIDDFYKKAEDMPKKPDGKPDYEALESFDLDLLHGCLKSLAEGKPTDVPHFDFQKGRRSDVLCRVTPPESGLVVMEGLHALNPVVYRNFVPENAVFGVFLDCHTDTPSEMHYSRFMRRLVRDYHSRRADAELTFYLWSGVLDGEKKYIYPFADLAKARINTRFDYESGVLRDGVTAVLGGLPADSRYRAFADTMLAYLATVQPLDASLVPADSLLREFIGE